MADSILGYALGDVSPELHRDLTETLPAMHLVNWSAREAASTTDALMELAQHGGACPWTTLMATPWLRGAAPLSAALIACHQAWPQLRIAVLFGAWTPAYQEIVDDLAKWSLYNCLITDDFNFTDLVDVVTADWPWETIVPYLSVPKGMNAPVQPTLPTHVSDSRQAATTPRASTAVAVVSAQGRAGKTGIIANLLTVLGSDQAAGLDLDVFKPSLPYYFRDAKDPVETHLQQLLVNLGQTPPMMGAATDTLTPQDKQEIREYVRRAVVDSGVRIIPGPRRQPPMTPDVPAGVAAELIRQAKQTVPLVFVDTPVLPDQPLWEEIVRTVDQVLLVTTADTLAILETILLMERLDRLRVPRSVVHLVINRTGVGRPPAEIAELHLHHPLFAAIPDQPKLWEAAFIAHQPLAHRQPKLWRTLAAAFMPTEEESEEVAVRPLSKKDQKRAARAARATL